MSKNRKLDRRMFLCCCFSQTSGQTMEETKASVVEDEDCVGEEGDESCVDETVESIDETEEEPEIRESLEHQIEQYELAIKKSVKTKNMKDEANALNDLGIVYYKVGRFTEALNCHERQLHLAELTQDKRVERRALCNLGCTAKNTRDYDRALESFQRGLDMATSEGDKKAEGKFLNNMASAYENMADFENAKKYYELRLQLAKTAKDIVGETKCCASLGNVMHVSGDIRASIRYFERVVICIKLRRTAESRKATKNQENSSEKPLEERLSDRDEGSHFSS